MAAVLSDHQPIRVVQTTSGGTALTDATPEKAAQTFLEGVPVMTVAGGFIQEWDANVVEPATAVAGIAGISRRPGANLGSNGAGAAGPFTGVGAPAAFPTFGSVLNQPNAVNFTPGAPFTDGTTPYEVADDSSIFEATFDSADGNAANATTAQSMENKHFGLTKDVTGHWYVDAQKVTQGTNTVVIITQLSPLDGPRQNGRVWFKFEKAIQQKGN